MQSKEKLLGTKREKTTIRTICRCKWKHQHQTTKRAEAGGVSSRSCRDLDCPRVENFSQLLSPRVGHSQGEEDRFIHELSLVLVQYKVSNLEAKLEQMRLLFRSSDKRWAHREAKTCSGGAASEMWQQRHQLSN